MYKGTMRRRQKTEKGKRHVRRRGGGPFAGLFVILQEGSVSVQRDNNTVEKCPELHGLHGSHCGGADRKEKMKDGRDDQMGRERVQG